MSDRDRLLELLGELRLRGMTEALERELERAEQTGSAPNEVLYRLLREEVRYRRERSLAYRLDQAKLPWPWTLETFPFHRQPSVNKAQIHTLAGLDFVRRASNLVFIGETGTGKSGLAIGLLRQACLAGFRGRFYDAQALLDELYASLADRSTAKLLNRLARYDALLIDELGYLTLKPEQINAFFRLMEQRYNRASTILTTNLDFEAWYKLLQNKPLVDALLDRLQHRCITIRINGPSLREPEPEPSSPTAEKRAPIPNQAKKKRTTRSAAAS